HGRHAEFFINVACRAKAGDFSSALCWHPARHPRKQAPSTGNRSCERAGQKSKAAHKATTSRLQIQHCFSPSSVLPRSISATIWAPTCAFSHKVGFPKTPLALNTYAVRTEGFFSGELLFPHCRGAIDPPQRIAR